jgi:hypothetical protein
MIRFFRSIRQGLINEGKTSKYFRYAVGEILLVMIGILLALQVNNWNEERKRATQERELSEKLYEELEGALEYNKMMSRYYDGLIEMIDRTLSIGSLAEVKSLLEEEKDYPGMRRYSFTRFITDAYRDYSPSIEVYKAAVSDGSIRLISNEALLSMLRLSFVRRPGSLENLLEKEIAKNVFIQNHIANHYAGLFVDSMNRVDGNWNQETEIKLMEAILQDGSIKYQLHEKRWVIIGKKLLIDNLTESAEEFLKSQGRIPNQ